MLRPIRQEDWDAHHHNWMGTWRLIQDDKLGLVVYDAYDQNLPYAYRYNDEQQYPNWVTLATFKLRQKLGHPAKKMIKQSHHKLPEPDFGLEEMALAEAIMNGE
jgi:hypothetical protein